MGIGRDNGDTGNGDRLSLLSSRTEDVALRLERKGSTWCRERAGETLGVDPAEELFSYS